MLTRPTLQTDFPLQGLNTFSLAAIARYYAQIGAPDQLSVLDQLPELAGLPRLILGGGSNVVLKGDYPGLVLHMAIQGREQVGEDDEFIYVRAGAGENWHDFVSWTLTCGWGGLENLSLIPGSVGAAPIQNIGAYGVELKDVFHALHWYEWATGTIHVLTDCGFGYRDSIFKNTLRDRGVILDVTFALPKQWQAKMTYGELAKSVPDGSTPTPRDIGDAICAIRRAKLPDPKLIANVGSFFKNPIVDADSRDALLHTYPELVSYRQPDGRFKLAAGWLIEQCGWKGRALGPVGMYQKQALVMVNLGGATGADVLALAQAIQQDVASRFAVRLEVEPEFV